MTDVPRLLLVAHQGRKAYENRLKREGWQVTVVATQEAAEARLAGSSPPPDVLVVDIAAPGSMGERLVPWVRQQPALARLPVLAVSLEASDEAFLLAHRAGAGDWLPLPFSGEAAATKVDALRQSAPTMAERCGTDDLVTLWRQSHPESAETDDELRQRLAAADAALADRAATEARGQLSLLPPEEAARFDAGEPAPQDYAAIDEAFRRARAAGRLREAVCAYDFKHPARFNKTQMRIIESLHEEYARHLAMLWSKHMRSVVNADVAFIDQTTYGEFIASLSNPNVGYEFRVSPFDQGQVVMDIATPLAFSLVDRVHGGRGHPAPVLQPRQLSQIEMGVLARFVRGALEHLEDTWKWMSGEETTIHDIMLETNPDFMQITAPAEIVLLIGIEVNSAHASGQMLLCYPFFTLEPILHRLAGNEGYGAPLRRGPDQRQANRLRLGDMRLPVVAELGRATLTAAQAGTLGEGDVIRLDARVDDPALLYVGGQPTHWAWPQQDERGQVEVQLAGRVPPALQGKLGRADASRPQAGSE